MPPKPAIKLTKKQLEEQKKEAARLQKQKQQQQAAAEKIRLEEEERVRQIERKKASEEERLRIVSEKEKNYPELEMKIKSENESFERFMRDKKWERFTTPYYKDYSVDGTNLSTFLQLFTNYQHTQPKLTLAECEQCEKYITKLQQKILEHRANYNEVAEKQCIKAIESLQKQEVAKLEQIMIGFANSGEEMEERNVEEAKRKSEQSSAQKAMKPIDSVYQMSLNFKIGMYINTISTKNYNKFNPIAIKQFGFNSEVPPKWTNNTTVVKFEWTSFNQFGSLNREQFRVVGGVFNLQFYDMFVGTKKTSNIAIKKFYKGRQILEKLKLAPSAIKQPFKVTYEIPKYVFMGPYSKNTIKIGQFDAQNNKWVVLPNESITDYLEQEKRVTCKISRPEPIAFIESRCADYPYIAWELRTVEPGKVLLDIELARSMPVQDQEPEQLMIQFEIGPNIMKLQTSRDYPEFLDLTQNYISPESMLWELSKRGVHLLPSDDDYEYAKIKPKDREAQRNAIRDVAYAVQAFSVRSQINDTSDIKVKIRENPDFENIFLEDQEKDWKRIRWGDKDKCWVDGRGISERHSNLEVNVSVIQTLFENHDFCDKQCVDRVKFNKGYLLSKTVMKVLQLTRILAFTVSQNNVRSMLVDTLKEKIIVQ